jgi:iron complex outermembrane receptor protein
MPPSHAFPASACTPSTPSARFELAPVALATALALGVMAATPAWAQTAPAAATQAVASINVPAQPLGDALNELARQANLQLLVRPELVQGKQAPAVSGRLTARQALDRLLAGSGLSASLEGSKVVLSAAPTPAASAEATLPTVRVTAGAEVTPGELPKPFTGGQVATGAQIKMLGNADVMTTPFSVKAYTNELIQNQGARSVDDVVANDPSIRASLSPGFVLDQSSIRGFVIFAGAYTVDGLPGIVSYSRLPVQNYERVEIFKGPTSALGGASVSGTAVGGSINLVPKRAMATPKTAVTLGAAGDSMLDAHVDLGRRFGERSEWGVRLNVLAEKGELSTGTKRENLAPQIALDYTGDRLRATLDAAVIDYKNRRIGVNHSLAAGQAVPRAPEGGRAAQPDSSQQALDAHWAIAGVEYDFLPALTGYAKYGKYHEESVDSYNGVISPLRSDGTFTINSYAYNTWKTDHDTQELGMRGKFETGPIKHQASVSALRFYRLYTAPPTGQTTVINTTPVVGNIYTDYAAPYVNSKPTLGAYTGTAIRQQSIGIADSMTMLDDKLNIVIGLRHQSIKQEAVAPAKPYDSSKVTPTLGVSYQLGGGWTVYGNYAEQLSQGAVAPTGTANAGQSLDPYVGEQHEFGAKWNAGTYGVTLAYFDIKQASAYTDPADNTFKAAGQQNNRGLEVETFGELTKGVRLLGGFAYIDAKQTKTRLGATDGKQALGVPKNNLNLGAEWDMSALPGLTLSGRVVHTGAAYVDLANTQQLPSWNRIDVGARYAMKVDGKAVTLRAGINNLMDKAYWMVGGRNLFAVAEPRTWRLSASMDF